MDIGTSSVRAFEGMFDGERLELKEFDRFYHTPVYTPVSVNWDMLGIYQNIEKMIRRAAVSGERVNSISLDSWGTDMVALNCRGELLTNGVGTQDRRFEGLKEKFFEIVPRHEIYERTGIQFLNWNSLYLLYSIAQDEPRLAEAIDCLLFAPDYFIYMLTGEKMCDYTIASTSQMLNPWSRSWDSELISASGISPDKLLPPTPGRRVGITRETGISLYSGCSHDTAAAVAGIPLQGEDELYLILGSWIMTGVELDDPVVTAMAESYNFSNEGGCNGRIRFLKNCMGMWLFQELQRFFSRKGIQISFEEMAKAGAAAEKFRSVIDVDAPGLRTSSDLPGTIKMMCHETGQQIPQTSGEVIKCIVNSIASKITLNMKQLEKCTGKTIRVIRAVGGGSQNKQLCQVIADMTGCPVYAGPVEASGYGNLLTQLVFSGEAADYEQSREILRNSVSIKIYEPDSIYNWG